MPHYEIFHRKIISKEKMQAFAHALTVLHCETFSAPSTFVNITFHRGPVGSGPLDQYARISFVGGVPVKHHNYIIAHIRPRPNSDRERLNRLVEKVTELWNEHVWPDDNGSFWKSKKKRSSPSNRLDDNRALHNVFILQDIDAGAEQGFILPVAGEDGQWVEKHMEEFKKRAQEGDTSMAALVEEVKRGLGSGPVMKSRI